MIRNLTILLLAAMPATAQAQSLIIRQPVSGGTVQAQGGGSDLPECAPGVTETCQVTLGPGDSLEDKAAVLLPDCTSASDSTCKITASSAAEFAAAAEALIPTYRSCYDKLSKVPDAASGIHLIDPDGAGTGFEPFPVYCDMSDGGDGAGWTRVMRGEIDDHNSLGAAWRNQTGDFNGALYGADSQGSFKFSDAAINAIRLAGNGVYRLNGTAGPYLPIRYAGPGCTYAHTATYADNSACFTLYQSYDGTLLSSPRTQGDTADTRNRGIADVTLPYLTFITNHPDNDWCVGNGATEYACGTTHTAHASGFEMWVR